MTKTIQMTIEEPLLEQVDATSSQLGLSRSAFVRQALRDALEQVRVAELERQHAAGYTRHPVEPGEFDVWQAEQAWGDA
ncbi:MAG: ribbon-helix-helix protein, CopG family [Anaerolineales bacterium]|nr:ribbon-helix-helix protein, CopG family [Anaerolineae bacterium]MCB9130882.1 ribbon-helix-helix protein, CopG family [Anaerolineales bacterium]